MRFSKAVVLGIVAFVALSAGLVWLVSQRYHVRAKFSADGLASLRANGFDYLQAGNLVVHDVVLRGPDGQTKAGATDSGSRFNPQTHELDRFFPWGDVKMTYAAEGNALRIIIQTTNTSPTDTIEGLWYQPIVFKLPAKAKEYDGSVPLLAHNGGQVGATKLSFGSGALAVVSEDVKRPLLIGFPWSDNRPENTIFPLSVSTGRVKSFPDSLPFIDRPIRPGATDRFDVSVRFGPASETLGQFTADVYQKFAQAYPFSLNWPDRRPIGSISLAASGASTDVNPRAWFNEARLETQCPQGCAEFRRRALALADNSIAILKEMNAQGVITSDIEGQQYNQAGYVGDPRLLDQLAPEMANTADEYFARFRRAGLRTGITVRPQQFQVSADRKSATQVAVADPAQVLIDKIGYAKKRWGISVAYIGSNLDAGDPNPMDVAVLAKVAAAYPDVLLIPEFSTLAYYAYSAPYKELRGGFTGTPKAVHSVYPKAFSVIYTVDGLMDYYKKDLVSAVASGDVLMFRSSWRDPQNEKVKALASR